jgi:hypothetical protein
MPGVQPTGSRVSSNSLSALGLDGTNLEVSVHELLGAPDRTEAALALTGDIARDFLDILQKVCFQKRVLEPYAITDLTMC